MKSVPTPENIKDVRESTKRTVMTWGGHGVVFERPNGTGDSYIDSSDLRHYSQGCCDRVIAVYKPDGSHVEGQEAQALIDKLGKRDWDELPDPPEPRHDPLDRAFI